MGQFEKRESILHYGYSLKYHILKTRGAEEEIGTATMCLSAASECEDAAAVAFFSELNDIFR